MASTPKHDDAEPPRSAGYGRPPVDRQIRDGEIRNPYGRRGKPKPSIDFLDEIVTLAISGKPTQVTRRQAIDHFLFREAAKGNVRAVAMLETRAKQRKEGLPEESELPAEEAAAFDRFVRRYANNLPSEDAS